MTNKRVRIAVVGFGKMGLVHASILNTMPNVDFVAICERNSFVRKFVKKAIHDVSVVENIDNLSGLSLDAVYVTTPIPSHFVVTKQILEKQIAHHIFVEKPLASNSSESHELYDLAQHYGGVNMVGYVRRFMVTFMKTKELLAQGMLGTPAHFAVNAFSSDFCGDNGNSNATAKRGSVLSDLGSYAIDLSHWFFGSLQVDSARIDAINDSGLEDSLHFDVSQQHGDLSGKLSISWCMEGYRMPEVNMSITGPKGSLTVNDDSVVLNLNADAKKVWYRHNLNESVRFCLGLPEYSREDTHFVDSIEKNIEAEPSFEAGSQVDSFIDQVREKAVQQ